MQSACQCLCYFQQYVVTMVVLTTEFEFFCRVFVCFWPGRIRCEDWRECWRHSRTRSACGFLSSPSSGWSALPRCSPPRWKQQQICWQKGSCIPCPYSPVKYYQVTRLESSHQIFFLLIRCSLRPPRFAFQAFWANDLYFPCIVLILPAQRLI